MLDGDPSTQPDKAVTVSYDGKPLRRPDGRGVEFAADGIALVARRQDALLAGDQGQDALQPCPPRPRGYASSPDELAAQVVAVGENGPADGLMISRYDGLMYVTSPQDDAVKVRDLPPPAAHRAC